MSTTGLPLMQDTGSNYKFSAKLMAPNKQHSQFDLSYLNTLSADPGQLVPVFFSYYYPGDNISLYIQNLVRLINVPLVPIMSRFRIFFHMFRMDYSQLWTYWESMMKKGWSGNFEAVLPTCSAPLAVDGKINPLLARGSLADYLGFNFSDYTYQSGDEDIMVDLPAMPFLMYQLVYRWYYVNHNIASSYALKENDEELLAFFPDTDYDLMIQDLAPTNLTLDGSIPDDKNLSHFHLGELRYRDFAEDYFTSALPWPMRGDVPSIDIRPEGSVIGVDLGDGKVQPLKIMGYLSDDGTQFSTIFGDSGDNATGSGKLSRRAVVNRATSTNEAFSPFSFSVGALHVGELADTIGNNKATNYNALNSYELGFPQGTFVFDQPTLKLLWTNTLISEKMARTDGTYGQFVQTFFGELPSHWSSHKPIYLGGTYQPLVISQVLQTAPGDTGMVGSLGATGISSSDGHVGSFHADDFGMTMCLMSIMPDTYYSQGWMKEHLYRTQDDFPLPERAQLGMQAITQGEIFYNVRDLDSNDILFGYQNRMDELRYRQNEIHGKVADPNALSFFPYTQSRYFDQAPTLVPSFLTTKDNIRRDWLSAPDEVTFIAQIANRVDAVRQLPYVAPPSAIIM